VPRLRSIAAVAALAALIAGAAGCGSDDESARGPDKPAGATATPTPDKPAPAY
jgi:hypothetical protein